MSALPQPRTEAVPAAAPAAGGGRRTLGVMLLLTALGAVLVLTAVGRVWAEGRVAGSQGATLEVSATGSRISELPGGLALVALAAAVALFAVRGAGRVAVGVLALLAGLGTAAASAVGAGDSAALHTEAARKLALSGTRATEVSHTLWPWLALVGGVLLAAAGLLTVRYGRSWPTMGSRYDAPTRKAPARAADTPADLWKALDRGEDPTAG